MTIRTVATSYAVIIASTLVALSALFAVSFRSADGDNEDNDGGGGGENREWRWEGPEAERAAKLVFGYSWMIVSTLALGFVAFSILRPAITSGAPVPRLKAGVLGGSTLLYANIALVCSLYFWNMKARNAEDENQQDRFLREDDDEGLGSYLLSILSLLLFAIYLLMSAFMLMKSSSDNVFWDEPVSNTPTECDMARSGAHLEVLWDAWRGFSSVSLALLLVILIVGITPLFIEEGERMKEDGYIFNFLFILVWMIFLSICFLLSGKRVLGGGTNIAVGRVEAGAFGGAVLFFSGLTFLLSVLYGSFSIEGHHGDGGPIGSLAFSFLCLFLAAANLLFAVGLYKYRRSIFSCGDVGVPRGESSNGDNFFVCMEQNKTEESNTANTLV